MSDINTYSEVVIKVCDFIFDMETLSDDLPNAFSAFIYEIIDNNKSELLLNAKDNCDFNGLLNDRISTLISKRAMRKSAEAFKDDTLDENWNESFFSKVKELFDNKNVSYKSTDILWIKDIIDARYWQIKNIEYIVSYTLNMSVALDDSFKNQTKEQYDELSRLVSSTIKSVESIKNDSKNITNEWKIKKEQLDNTISSTNNLMPNMLTSLGIFVTIIVTIIALYISNVLRPTQIEFSIPQMRYARYILSGQIIFNCIFFLLYFISKLSGKTIHLSSISEDKLKGLERLNAISASLFYNPLIWIINFISVFAYFILCDWWMFERYIWPVIETWIGINNISYNWPAFWFAVVSIIILTAIPIVAMALFYHLSMRKLNKEIENANKNQDVNLP